MNVISKTTRLGLSATIVLSATAVTGLARAQTTTGATNSAAYTQCMDNAAKTYAGKPGKLQQAQALCNAYFGSGAAASGNTGASAPPSTPSPVGNTGGTGTAATSSASPKS